MNPRRFMIRIATPDDLLRLAQLETEVWGARAASSEELRRRLEVPGFETILVEDDEKVLAFAQAKWVFDRELEGIRSWTAILANPPQPNGDVAYGINLTARAAPRAAGAGRAALDALLALVVHRKRRMFVAGGRLPGFRKWAPFCPADVYVRLFQREQVLYFIDRTGSAFEVGICTSDDLALLLGDRKSWTLLAGGVHARVSASAEPLDPFLRMLSQARCCGLGVELLGLMPDYYGDPESLDYGVLYAWGNPLVLSDSRAEHARLTELVLGSSKMLRL